MTWICVEPISIPMLLPSSIRSCSLLIILYLFPYPIKKPTPLLPLTALSKFWPIHSYPLMSISSFPFKWVSETARISGFSSCRNYMTLYFFAVIPFTFTWIIFNKSFSFIFIYVFVAIKYSSSFVYLLSFRSSLLFQFLAFYYCWFSISASPLIHCLIF